MMIQLLIQYRRWLLAGVGLFTLLFIWGLSLLRPDFSFDAFFPKDDPDFVFYQRYQEQFAESQNLMYTVALKAPGKDVYDAAFIAKADSIFGEIGNLEGLDSMILATRFQEYRRRGLGFRNTVYLQYDTPEALAKTQEKVQKDSLFLSTFVSRDQQYLAGYFFLNPELFDKPGRNQVSEAIQNLVTQSGLAFHISGQPFIRSQYIRKLVQELLLFLSLSAFFLIAALWLLYRSFWGIALPLLTAVGALIWTLGFMGLTGEPLSILSNLLIPIMFVVSMSSVIHLLTKFLALSNQGYEREEALSITLKQIGLATFLTNLTTAIGFGALMISRMAPIKMFGLYAATGVFFTFIMAITILTVGLLAIPSSWISRKDAFSNSPRWDKLLASLDQMIFRRPKTIAGIFVLMLAVSIFFTTRIPLNNFLLQDMHPRDPVALSMKFFEKQFHGLRPFDLAFETRGNICVSDRLFLLELEKIQDFLDSRARFSPFLSPVTVIENINLIYHYNRDPYYRIPDSQEEIDDLLAFVELNRGDALLSQVMDEDRKLTRISSRLNDIGSEAFEDLANELDTFISTRCDTSLFTYRVTGQAALTDHNLTYLRDSLLKGLLIAFVLIAGIMAWLFRSGRMLAISLIPNIVPLLFTGGLMGLFGITLGTSTAIVFVIAFGIAVDDTIHFLTRYRLERKKGLTVDEAIHQTIKGTGKAIILASLVLLCGFSLLMFSDFGGTFNTGFFTALTIVFALMADLFLLPLLLRWFERS